MEHYFRLINLPGSRLARRCGVSHSQIYMARTRNVGADDAEKIARGMSTILRLSEEERLALKAEIMGHPGELVRAYLGDSKRAARLLDFGQRCTYSPACTPRSVDTRSLVTRCRQTKSTESSAIHADV